MSLWAATAALAMPAVQAADSDPTSAPALAAALAADPGTVTGASFLEQPASGGTALASSRPVSGFPHAGADFAVLSTGEATGLYPGSGSQYEDRDGQPVRGSSADDVTVLQVDVQVPVGDNCLTGVDFRFLSDEYPELVGQRVNDAFVMEVDRSTWTTAGSEIAAPDNLALDEIGHPISINAAGAASMSTSLSIGTTTSGATRTFRASAPISPGAHRLFFSIFDQGDPYGDSDVLLDNLAFGHVDDPATGCRPGISAPYGDAIDAPAPTFDDAAGTYTIPQRTGVAYDVDLAPTPPGTHPSEAGTTMTVTAQPTGDDFLEGPSAWTHYVPQADRVPVWTEDPVFTDLPGGAQDTVSVPRTPGVVYTLGGKDLTEAVTDAPASGDVRVTATAEPGHVVEGATSWRHQYSSGPGTYDVRNPDRPTADLDKGTYTIPEDVSGRYFQIDGTVVDPGTYQGRGTVEVTSDSPGEAGPREADNRWSFTFPGLPFLQAAAEAPTFLDSGDGHGSVVVPGVPGVTYRIDRRRTDPGATYEVSGPTTVTARPDADHGLEGPSAWSHTFEGVGSSPVVPAAPAVQDQPGTSGDTFTVPTQTGVRFLVDGDVATAGTHSAAGRAVVELTAVAPLGYELTGTTSWRLPVSRAPGTLTTTRPTTSGRPRVGGTLTAHSGDWSPSGVTYRYQWRRDGATVRGARGLTYVLRRADRGHRMSVRVTGSRTDYATAVRESARTARVRR